MKKIIILLLTLVMTFSTSVSMLANEHDASATDSEIVSTDNDTTVEECGLEDTETDEELAEQQEKAQERLILILILIGMVIALGTLYTLKYIAYKKENNK